MKSFWHRNPPGFPSLVLNGCRSHLMAEELQMQLKAGRGGVGNQTVHVVCCDSLVTDRFAAAFVAHLCSKVTWQGTSVSDSISEAFQSSVDHFASPNAEFSLGDPAAHLHTPTEQADGRHAYDPQCPGCNPPVHGQYRIVTCQV